MRTFNVDMIPGGSQTAVACNQYEKGDIWVFALYYDGGRYNIPAGATVSITGQKSDGAAFNVPASVSDNTVLVTVTEQMTAAYGKCIAEVLVQSGNTTLYTANFYVLVEPAAVQVPLADTTLPLSITAQDGTVYVQSDLEEATEQMITLAAQQQYQQDLAAGVAQRVVEQYAGSTLAGSRQTVKSAIDALNSNMSRVTFTRSAVSTAGKTFAVPSNYRGLFWVCDSNSNNVGEYMMYATSAGLVAYVALRAVQNLTFATAANSLTLTAASGTRIVVFVNLGGTVNISEA